HDALEMVQGELGREEDLPQPGDPGRSHRDQDHGEKGQRHHQADEREAKVQKALSQPSQLVQPDSATLYDRLMDHIGLFRAGTHESPLPNIARWMRETMSTIPNSTTPMALAYPKSKNPNPSSYIMYTSE